MLILGQKSYFLGTPSLKFHNRIDIIEHHSFTTKFLLQTYATSDTILMADILEALYFELQIRKPSQVKVEAEFMLLEYQNNEKKIILFFDNIW